MTTSSTSTTTSTGTSTGTSHVTVLGLGRMGTAVARRLAERLPVTTWTRSGGPGADTLPGIQVAATAAAAVKDADVVVLALYDAAACRAVLADCLGDLSPDAVVLNTTTVGPDDARSLAELVQGSGAGYLHAPVVGSLPAVAAGALTVLAGGAPEPRAVEVLEHLGTVIDAGGPATAAALKLVAAGALADGLLGVRSGLERGRAAGLDPDLVLTVLERSPLGALVRAKRDRLVGTDSGGAQFTVGALAKDLDLLVAASGAPHPTRDLVAALSDTGVLAAHDDVAALCTAGARARPGEVPEARLRVRPGLRAPEEVLAPLVDYARGHATGRPEHFRRAFLPTAHVEGLRDGVFASWDLDTYCGLFDGPATDEHRRRRVVEAVEVAGTVASARMTLDHGEHRFTDLFLLVRPAAGWRIANKTYHRD